MKEKIYKANGKTFQSWEEVRSYAKTNGFEITSIDRFLYKGETIVLVNLKSIN